MSARRIIVVCKYNQARSITAAAALRRFFPDKEIITAGIQANPAMPIPSSILEILDQWAITEYDHRSTPVVNLANVSPSDLILCADIEVKETLIAQLKIANPHEYKIHTFEDFAYSSLEVPVDPVNMGEADTKMQLARSIVLCIRAVRKENDLQPPVTLALFPHDKAQHLQAQDQLVTEINSNAGVIVDTGFSIPNRLLWQAHASKFLPVNPNRFVIDWAAKRETGIYISKFEVDFAPRIFLSLQYRDWLAHISEQQKIYTLAQPASELPPSRQHEAVLGLIHS